MKVFNIHPSQQSNAATTRQITYLGVLKMISEKTIDKCYEAASEFFVKHEKQTEVRYLIDEVTVIAKRTGSNVKMHIFSQFNARFKYGTWEFDI